MNNRPSLPEAQIIIALGLHASILIYVFVAFIMSHNEEWIMGWRVAEEFKILFAVLTFVSFLMAAIVFMIPRLMGLSEANQETILSGSYISEKNSNEVTPTIKQTNVTVIQMALAESIALFGLVLSILNKSFMIIIPYAFFSLAIQFSVSPLRKKLFSQS